MKEMSRFLSAFAADPEEQRFSKAVVQLRSLVFSPFSDDHIVALALLYDLSELYRQAFGSDQILHDSAQGGAQEEALAAHLRALGLPGIADLEPLQLEALIGHWEPRCTGLPQPFDKTMERFVQHAKTQLSAGRTPAAV